MKVWITRDSCPVGGEPFEWVYIWSRRPERYPVEEGYIWRADPEDTFAYYINALWLDQCERWVGTIPADGREVIVAEVNTEARAGELRRQMDAMRGTE